MLRHIENPQNISIARFEDAYGVWAKRWCVVARVYIEFNDGREPLSMTPQEFTALGKDIQNAVYAAPSSRPAQVIPTAQAVGGEP